nr:alpha-isocomene synthase [Tanacetum cinerariifolium]
MFNVEVEMHNIYENVDIKKEEESSDIGDEEGDFYKIESPLDLLDTKKEHVYDQLIDNTPLLSLESVYKIKKGNSCNKKFLCMVGHKYVEDVIRPNANFPSEIWGDQFIANDQDEQEGVDQVIEDLKEEVRSEILTA